jgi:hypothetical protein
MDGGVRLALPLNQVRQGKSHLTKIPGETSVATSSGQQPLKQDTVDLASKPDLAVDGNHRDGRADQVDEQRVGCIDFFEHEAVIGLILLKRLERRVAAAALGPGVKSNGHPGQFGDWGGGGEQGHQLLHK